MPLPGQQSTNLKLSSLPEIDQQKYPEIWSELFRIRQALGLLSGSLDVYTGALSEDPAVASYAATQQTTYLRLQNISRLYVLVTESVSQGQLIHLFDSGGVLSARLANATDGTRPCRGYCNTAGTTTVGNYIEAILAGVNPYLSGLTRGATYYLDTTAGGVTATAPAAVGNIEQAIGFALSTSNLYLIPPLTWIQH